MNPATDKTWHLVEKVIEYAKNTFTSEYLHMGGDEVNTNCWDFNPEIKVWMDQ